MLLAVVGPLNNQVLGEHSLHHTFYGAHHVRRDARSSRFGYCGLLFENLSHTDALSCTLRVKKSPVLRERLEAGSGTRKNHLAQRSRETMNCVSFPGARACHILDQKWRRGRALRPCLAGDGVGFDRPPRVFLPHCGWLFWSCLAGVHAHLERLVRGMRPTARAAGSETTSSRKNHAWELPER